MEKCLHGNGWFDEWFALSLYEDHARGSGKEDELHPAVCAWQMARRSTQASAAS